MAKVRMKIQGECNRKKTKWKNKSKRGKDGKRKAGK